MIVAAIVLSCATTQTGKPLPKATADNKVDRDRKYVEFTPLMGGGAGRRVFLADMIGMTREQVLANLGEPESAKRRFDPNYGTYRSTDTGWYKRQYWVYWVGGRKFNVCFDDNYKVRSVFDSPR